MQPENIDGRSNCFEDMKRFTRKRSQLTIFDIGANVGQTIDKFKHYFPVSVLHAFEPGSATFEELFKNYKETQSTYLYKMALGSTKGEMEFFENDNPDMSSFLEIDRMGWGKIIKTTMVKTITIDEFCEENSIDKIDILKTDTQGFEFEVLKGASQMMKANKIQLIYLEIIFSEQYKGLPSCGDIYNFLIQNNFRLIKFYDFRFQENLSSWADALFVNQKFERD